MDLSTGLLILIGASFIVDKIVTVFKSRGMDLHKMSRRIDDLWVWHSKEDSDGVKIWYVRPSLEKSLEKLAENIEKQTELLKMMHMENKHEKAS